MVGGGGWRLAIVNRSDKRVPAAGGGSVCLKLPNRRHERGPSRLKLPNGECVPSFSPPPIPSRSLLGTLVPCLCCRTHSALPLFELPLWE